MIGIDEKGLIESVHDFILELLDELENIKFISLFGLFHVLSWLSFPLGSFKDMV